MAIAMKLMVDQKPNYDIQIIKEQKNPSEPERLYIEGVFMEYGVKNKNGRIYLEDEMHSEVDRYIKECVETGSAVGELNHSDKPEIDLGRVCDRIVSLRNEGTTYIGKSMVTTNTPMGKILEGLIKDGVRVGKSTKALGHIEESSGDKYVKGFMLMSVDTVHDPSCMKAYVEGILESKEFIINTNGRISEAAYASFENKLANLPLKDKTMLNEHIEKAVKDFLNTL